MEDEEIIERNARLTEIYNSVGKPGARVFRTTAKKKGFNLTQKEAIQFVAGQSMSQIFQNRINSDGKITASREGIRWQADLLDFSRRIEGKHGGKYALTVIDIFTREVRVEAMKNKSDKTTVEAMRKILADNNNIVPIELSVDMGNEFGYRFEQYVTNLGIQLRVKDPAQLNALSGIDRAQQTIKQILRGVQGDGGWESHIKAAVKIYNEREHSALFGASPEEVADNHTIQYYLEAENGQKVLHNNKKWRRKVGKIKDAGAFRVPKVLKDWPRVDEPRYEGTVHKAGPLKGANIVDETGKSFPVRKLLAVPFTSTDVNLQDDLIPGSKRRQDQRTNLKPFADQLKQKIADMSGSMAFKMVTAYLNGLPGFLDTVAVYRLPREKYVYFLRLFGFHISGSGTAIIVRNTGRLRSRTGPPTPSGRPVPSTPREPSSSSGIIRPIPTTPQEPSSSSGIIRPTPTTPQEPSSSSVRPTPTTPQEPSSSSGIIRPVPTSSIGPTPVPVPAPIEQRTKTPKHGNITMLQENPYPLHGEGWTKYELYKSATSIKSLKNKGIASYYLGQYFDRGYITLLEIQPVDLPVTNPYRAGGMRHVRYEVYKHAKNIDEVKQMGALPVDMTDLRVKGLLPPL